MPVAVQYISSHGNQPRRPRARPAVHSRNGLQRDRDSRPMGRRRTLPRKVHVRRAGSCSGRRGAVRSPRDRAARPRASGMDPAAVRRWPACSRGSCGGGHPARAQNLLSIIRASGRTTGRSWPPHPNSPHVPPRCMPSIRSTIHPTGSARAPHTAQRARQFASNGMPAREDFLRMSVRDDLKLIVWTRRAARERSAARERRRLPGRRSASRRRTTGS